jgi:hypothetical protein
MVSRKDLPRQDPNMSMFNLCIPPRFQIGGRKKKRVDLFSLVVALDFKYVFLFKSLYFEISSVYNVIFSVFCFILLKIILRHVCHEVSYTRDEDFPEPPTIGPQSRVYETSNPIDKHQGVLFFTATLQQIPFYIVELVILYLVVSRCRVWCIVAVAATSFR